MSQRFKIENFPEKIDLLFQSGRGGISSVHALSWKVDFIALDYLQRIVSGSRQLSRKVFSAIVKASEPAGLCQGDWFEDVPTFGAKLGMSVSAIAGATKLPNSGIDFRSRNADAQNLRSLYKLIGGYWECFYYSVSTFGK